MRELMMVLPLVLGVVLGYLFARGARGLGQKLAVTSYTFITSVIDTIDRQVRLFGRTSVVAVLLLIAAAGLMIFTPSTGTSWAPLLGKVIGFAANIALGFAAGVGANVVAILSIPAIRDSIDCQLEMKRRTRRRLSKFLAMLLILFPLQFAGSGPSYAGEGFLVLAIDRTDSMDPVQRETGAKIEVEAALEKARRLHASAILVVIFDEEIMLSDMAWVLVPPERVVEDCRDARPVPVAEEGFITFAPGLAAGRKQQSVDECLVRQGAGREREADERRTFRERLAAATRVTPRADVTTRIVPLLQWLVQRPNTLAVDLLTDGIDRSGMPLNSLRIPVDMPVTLIITRPNPKRATPSLDDVLAAARAWERVPGIKVTTVGEYAALSATEEEGKP